jgi:hypothetical protein
MEEKFDILNSSSSERGKHVQNLLQYCRYNCGIFLTNHIQLSLNENHDLKYLAKSFIPENTRVLYMPASCRISFELYQQELSIPWGQWEFCLRSMINDQKDPSKILTPHKILFTIGMIGLLKKYSYVESSRHLSLSAEYLSLYWKGLPIPNEEEILLGWNLKDLNETLSTTSFLFHDLIPSSLAHLQHSYQRYCLPFMNQFPHTFSFSSPAEGPGPTLLPGLPLSLENGYLSFDSFLALYQLITSRTFATDIHPSSTSYDPLMLLPIIDYLNGTSELSEENCAVEFYSDDQNNDTDTTTKTISSTSSTSTTTPNGSGPSVKGMYNVITKRDILPGEELILSYLPAQETSLSVYLFTYGTLPPRIKQERFFASSSSSLSSETLSLHLSPSLIYLQSLLPSPVSPISASSIPAAEDLARVFESLSQSVRSLSCDTLHLSVPLSISHQQFFKSLSSYLASSPLFLLLDDKDSTPQLKLLNCLMEMLCCLPHTPPLPPAETQASFSLAPLSPSQSLFDHLTSLFSRWSDTPPLIRSTSLEMDHLRCALILSLIEHLLRLETLKYFKHLLSFSSSSPPLTQYENRGCDLMNRISNALLDHASRSPNEVMKEQCVWCGKSEQLSQCGRCQGVRYCRYSPLLLLLVLFLHILTPLLDSTTCQRAHWKKHKLACQPLQYE